MNELEELNVGEMGEVAGGALQIPNTVKVTSHNRLTRFVRQPSDIRFTTVRKISHDRRIF